jgi:hypothetical protein
MKTMAKLNTSLGSLYLGLIESKTSGANHCLFFLVSSRVGRGQDVRRRQRRLARIEEKRTRRKEREKGFFFRYGPYWEEIFESERNVSRKSEIPYLTPNLRGFIHGYHL